MDELKKTEPQGVDLTKITQDLRAEVAALREDVTKRGAAMARTGRESAAAVKSAARSAARQGYAKGEETMEEVLAELQTLEEELADATRRRPFAALGIATLIGFLVGVLFRR